VTARRRRAHSDGSGVTPGYSSLEVHPGREGGAPGDESCGASSRCLYRQVPGDAPWMSIPKDVLVRGCRDIHTAFGDGLVTVVVCRERPGRDVTREVIEHNEFPVPPPTTVRSPTSEFGGPRSWRTLFRPTHVMLKSPTLGIPVWFPGPTIRSSDALPLWHCSSMKDSLLTSWNPANATAR
jgi:hypothetical protein